MAAEGPKAMIKRVVVKNYRSMADVDVELGPLTFLVGPNGSGKSNFLDALRFVKDALDHDLSRAFSHREVHMAALAHFRDPKWFSIAVETDLPGGRHANYGFKIRFSTELTGSLDALVAEESCSVQDASKRVLAGYELREGKLTVPPEGLNPKVSRDRLVLPVISASPEFRDVRDHLTGLAFYDIAPDELGASSLLTTRLAPDGSNAGAMIWQMRNDPGHEGYSSVNALLNAIIPGASADAREERLGREGYELFFSQQMSPAESHHFEPQQMSEGTLRALGNLIALYQHPLPPLVAIEEPERAIHPAALGAVLDAIRAASARTQVLVATQSADILEGKDIQEKELRLCSFERGQTKVSGPGEYSRKVMAEKLYNAGELMRMGQLLSDEATSGVTE